MRKLLPVILLVLLSIVSCERESVDTDLLYGSWILESNSGHPGSTVDFISGGDYCMVDYINLLVGGSAVYRCTITGEFSVRGNLITLHTANVESIEDGTVGTGFPYEGGAVSDGSPMGSFYGSQGDGWPRTAEELSVIPNLEYEPVVWEIISLRDSLLEVKFGIETFRYIRR